MTRITKVMLEEDNKRFLRVNSDLRIENSFLKDKLKWMEDFRKSNTSMTIALERISDSVVHTL